MSSTRRSFIVAAGVTGAALAVPGTSIAAEPPKPSPSPTASPPPSPASRAIAAQMRRFDPSLSDDQVEQIASGIEEQNRYAARIRERQPLHNGDEPSPEFSVR